MRIGDKQAIGENLLYLLVWSTIVLVPVLNSQMLSEMHVNLNEAWIVWRQLIPYLLIFLVHNYLISPQLLFKRMQAVLYLLASLAFISVVFFIVDLYQQALITHESYSHAHDAITRHEVYWNILFALFMCGTNSGIKFIYQSARVERQMEQLKQENLRAEMNALTYQINPHFFMNTLNNIHALIDIDSEAAKSAVIDLSKMMRYVLYDSERETVSLAQDIQFLRNYIELMRIRYSDEVEITIDYPHEIPDSVVIPPLLLIVFVENAFKHGVSYCQRSYIHISIFVTADSLTAIFSNSRNEEHGPKAASGIGLENVLKRLELTYGKNGFTLDLHEEPTSYSVKLVIPTPNA